MLRTLTASSISLLKAAGAPHHSPVIHNLRQAGRVPDYTAFTYLGKLMAAGDIEAC